METLTDPRTLSVGDICDTKKGTRCRVQKVYGYGLRLRTTEHGANDYTWEQLEDIGLVKRNHDENGPAARRLGELRQEATRLGVDITGLKSTKEVTTAIGMHLAGTDSDILQQIDPMLAADGKGMQDYSLPKPWESMALFPYWSTDKWVAEEKLDGVRLKLHLTETGGRVDSRRQDTKTRRFSEKSNNFPHIRSLIIPDLLGTVIDTEAMLPVTSGISPVSGKPFHGSLSISTACTNAGPESAALIQNAFGPMQIYAFDLLYAKGKSLMHLSAKKRRQTLEKLINWIWDNYPETREWLRITRQNDDCRPEGKLKFYEDIIASGGEGIIFKDQDAPYQMGKRSKAWTKLKKFQEVDAYVTGFIPGENMFEGLAGALELSVMIDGQEIPIAAVSQITLIERQEMTDPTTGGLKPEYYGRVVTFRGQEISKNGRYRHAIFVGWREDKTKEQCNGYEVLDDLRSVKRI